MTASTVSGLTCMRCGRRWRRGLDGPCPRCGPEGVLDVEFDLKQVRRTLTRRALASRPQDMWRYRELLPVPEQRPAAAGAGGLDAHHARPAPRRLGRPAHPARQGRRAQSHRVVQGPRERGRGGAGRRAAGAHRGLRVHRQRRLVAGGRRRRSRACAR